MLELKVDLQGKIYFLALSLRIPLSKIPQVQRQHVNLNMENIKHIFN